jgi:hypothetical protein
MMSAAQQDGSFFSYRYQHHRRLCNDAGAATVRALPAELLLLVLSRLSAADLLCCLRVSRRWRHIAAGNPWLWRRLDLGTLATAEAALLALSHCDSLVSLQVSGLRCADPGSVALLLHAVVRASSGRTLRALSFRRIRPCELGGTNVFMAGFVAAAVGGASLESLELCFIDEAAVPGLVLNTLVRMMLERAPRLKTLRLDCCPGLTIRCLPSRVLPGDLLADERKEDNAEPSLSMHEVTGSPWQKGKEMDV